jgi:cytochrome c biogenesis protein CcdA
VDLDVSAGGALLAGLLSFSSPCVLPLVPPYLAFVGGICLRVHALSARFKKRLALIKKAMGAFLVAAGMLILTGQMPNIAFWLLGAFPALNGLG